MMNNKNLLLILTFLFSFAILLQSCATTKRNLVYFSDLPDSLVYNQEIQNQLEAKIQPGDALAIKVTTLNPDANILYNSGSLPMNNPTTGVSTGVKEDNKEGYLVDNNGNINFPLLGEISLSGLTREQAQKKIFDLVSKTDKGAIVNVAIQNFKVTVIGEVLRPGTFSVDNDRINVLEALGMAGDMTPYSVRENVLVIREKNGIRSMQRLNLTQKDVFKSPFFYLQQNDVVYVQPENKLKAQEARSNSYRWVPILTAAISALAIVLSRVL